MGNTFAAKDNAGTGLAEELAADFAALQAWWREAGVETPCADEPRRWLRPVEAEPEGKIVPATGPSPAAREPGQQATTAAPRLGGDPARWPGSLAEFADWWLAEPSLGLAGDGRRVPPRGPAGAQIMALVPQPEASDDKRLLDGREGALLAAILATIGVSEEQAYVASVLPAHVGLIDWPLLAEAGMADVLAHHVRLVAPKRLLVLGRQGIGALLGHGPTDIGLASPHFNDSPLGVPIACAPELGGLLERPARKAAVWRLLLDWGV